MNTMQEFQELKCAPKAGGSGVVACEGPEAAGLEMTVRTIGTGAGATSALARRCIVWRWPSRVERGTSLPPHFGQLHLTSLGAYQRIA